MPRLWKSTSIALNGPALLVPLAAADVVDDVADDVAEADAVPVAELVAEVAAEAGDEPAAPLMLFNSDCSSEAALPEVPELELPEPELPEDDP